MQIPPLTSLSANAAGPEPAGQPTPERLRGAAKQFEALLIAQMLRMARSEEDGWLGSGDGGAAQSAVGFAEEGLAMALAEQGGLGLADTIVNALDPNRVDPHTK
jgi:Rod binding domain-containing protein